MKNQSVEWVLFDHDHMTHPTPPSQSPRKTNISPSSFFILHSQFPPITGFRWPASTPLSDSGKDSPVVREIHGFWFPVPVPGTGTGSSQEKRRRFRYTAVGSRDSIALPLLLLHSLSAWLAASHARRFLCPQPHFSPLTVQNRLHRLVILHPSIQFYDLSSLVQINTLEFWELGILHCHPLLFIFLNHF